MKNPKWGPDLSQGLILMILHISLEPQTNQKTAGMMFPAEIKDKHLKNWVFQKPKESFLAGVSTQFESEVVYHFNIKRTR